MQNIIAVEDEQKIKEGIGKPEVIPVSSSASSRGPETGLGEVWTGIPDGLSGSKLLTSEQFDLKASATRYPTAQFYRFDSAATPAGNRCQQIFSLYELAHLG